MTLEKIVNTGDFRGRNDVIKAFQAFGEVVEEEPSDFYGITEDEIGIFTAMIEMAGARVETGRVKTGRSRVDELIPFGLRQEDGQDVITVDRERLKRLGTLTLEETEALLQIMSALASITVRNYVARLMGPQTAV